MAAPCPDVAESGDSRPSDVAMITTLEPRVVPAQSGNQVHVQVEALQPCATYHVLFGGSVVGAARVADLVLVAHAPPHTASSVNVEASRDSVHFIRSKAIHRYVDDQRHAHSIETNVWYNHGKNECSVRLNKNRA